MTTLADIEAKACAASEARELLTAEVQALNDEIEAAKRARIRTLKRLVARAAQLQVDLLDLVHGAPHLFEKPKSQIFHAMKCGYARSRGSIDWDDDETVVARIEKLFPAQADQLINVKKTPSKTALVELTGKELKTLGVTVIDAGDVAFVRPIDGAVDKLVNALLKGAVDEAVAADGAA